MRGRSASTGRTSGLRRLALAALGLALLAAVGLTVLSFRPAIARAPSPPQTDPVLVAQGAALARLGYCSTCHTASPDKPFAGGRPMKTPFGTLYATNITPDPQTGIGGWSREAFTRAMRQGVSRDGHHLYPAFPYDHFSRLQQGDIDALYAFLMSRRPIRATAPANRLIPPLGFRPLLAGWNLLFFHPGEDPPATGAEAQLARGRYLAEGLSHCGGCHSPRNAFGAERRDRAYAGGWAEGWYAPPLDARNPAASAWTAERLYGYLRTGLDVNHAAAAGPMGPVVRQLAAAPPADVQAIAAYIASRMGARSAAPGSAPVDRKVAARAAHPQGAVVFAGACATCHEDGAPMRLNGRPALQLGSPLHEDDPRDTVQIILQGLQPPTGPAGPYMPAFGDTLTDAQVAELAAYLRARYSERPAWRDLPKAVAKARKEGGA